MDEVNQNTNRYGIGVVFGEEMATNE